MTIRVSFDVIEDAWERVRKTGQWPWLRRVFARSDYERTVTIRIHQAICDNIVRQYEEQKTAEVQLRESIREEFRQTQFSKSHRLAADTSTLTKPATQQKRQAPPERLADGGLISPRREIDSRSDTTTVVVVSAPVTTPLDTNVMISSGLVLDTGVTQKTIVSHDDIQPSTTNADFVTGGSFGGGESRTGGSFDSSSFSSSSSSSSDSGSSSSSSDSGGGSSD